MHLIKNKTFLHGVFLKASFADTMFIYNKYTQSSKVESTKFQMKHQEHEEAKESSCFYKAGYLTG